MDPSSESTPQAFVGYSSRDRNLAEMISLGVAKANRKVGKRIRHEPWEFNDIAGNPVVSPVLEGIDASKYVVADITYLNLKVFMRSDSRSVNHDDVFSFTTREQKEIKRLRAKWEYLTPLDMTHTSMMKRWRTHYQLMSIRHHFKSQLRLIASRRCTSLSHPLREGSQP